MKNIAGYEESQTEAEAEGRLSICSKINFPNYQLLNIGGCAVREISIKTAT